MGKGRLNIPNDAAKALAARLAEVVQKSSDALERADVGG